MTQSEISDNELARRARQRRASLSEADAAIYLNLGPRTLQRFRQTGGGPLYVRSGYRVSYDPDDLDAWRDAHKRRSTSELRVA